jgi:hypothetical protein
MYRAWTAFGAWLIALGVFFLGAYYAVVLSTHCTINQYGCGYRPSDALYFGLIFIGFGLAFLFYSLLTTRRRLRHAERVQEPDGA